MHHVGKAHLAGMAHHHCSSQKIGTCPDACVIHSVCIHLRVSNESLSAVA